MQNSARRPPTLGPSLPAWAIGPPVCSYETTSTIAITQPESWYSFYRPTEGRRLSRPRWLVMYSKDALPAREQSPIQVAQNKARGRTPMQRPVGLLYVNQLFLHMRCQQCQHITVQCKITNHIFSVYLFNRQSILCVAFAISSSIFVLNLLLYSPSINVSYTSCQTQISNVTQITDFGFITKCNQYLVVFNFRKLQKGKRSGHLYTAASRETVNSSGLQCEVATYWPALAVGSAAQLAAP